MRLGLILGSITIVGLMLVGTASSELYDIASCGLCTRSFRMVWPVSSTQYASDPYISSCRGNPMPGHWGYDLLAADGETVYAAFSGTVTVGFEPETKDYYDLGLYLHIESDFEGGRYVANYGHMMENGLAVDGQHVRLGDALGYAGGGQDGPNRGDSPGPMLYFELLDLNGWPQDSSLEGEAVDPETCAINTCKFWYATETGGVCTPKLDNEEDCQIKSIATAGGGRWWFDMPSYACGSAFEDYSYIDEYGDEIEYTEDRDSRYYAIVSIDKYGRIKLGCDGSGSDETCKSEIFDYRLDPRFGKGGLDDFNDLNCFLKFVKVESDGTYTCGEIDGDTVDWEAMDADECNVVSIGVANQSESRNIGLTRLMQIKTGDIDDYTSYVVVGNEYVIIGVDDSDYVDNVAKVNSLPTDRYEKKFILTRACDIRGLVSKNICKNKELAGVDKDILGDTPDYEGMISDGAYQDCEYIMVDAGKYYDEPGKYIASFWMGRLAANTGKMYYD